MRSSHTFRGESAVFDDPNLVSCAGLVPGMALAEQTQLMDLLAENVVIKISKVKSGAANPAPKLTTLIAGMCAGADCIDDIDLLRSGGMKHLFDTVYAPSTVGTLLREFTFGHNRQLESVLRQHLIALAASADILPGIADRVLDERGLHQLRADHAGDRLDAELGHREHRPARNLYGPCRPIARR